MSSGWHAVGLAALMAGCADPSLGGRRQPIVNGTSSGDDSVVALRARQIICGLPTAPLCTATVIAPRVLITAAHCFNSHSAAAVEVVVGADIDAPDDVLYVEDVRIHPDYDRATLDNDLAMVRLAASVELSPVLLLETMDQSFVGRPARMVGYGVSVAGDLVSAGVRRSGDGEISVVGAPRFRVIPSPAMSCEGDSGGPVLIDEGGGDRLAGVTSWGDDDCVEFAMNTRVPHYLAAFIQPYLDETAGLAEPADAGPGRSGAVAVCDEPCTRDDDCPDGTVCQLDGPRARCGYPGGATGEFTGDCTSSGECAGEMCLARERAGRPDCGCFNACPVPTVDAGTDCAGDDCGDDPGGCCDAGGANAPWLLVLLAAALLRRRKR
jgi:hypothetical protein